jgi:dTDP-4-amino-4,6-dideoxygalactose transaminase
MAGKRPLSRDDIPLADLAATHAEIAAEIRLAFEKVFVHGGYVLGHEVTAFEQAFARFTGMAHCVGVGNGTDALELTLRALGIGPGDEVLVPVNTFHATAAAVVRAGATPVLVDCEPEYLLLDPDQARERVGARTRAVVPVHLYGQMVAMEKLASLADRGVHIVEDAAQAHGATRFGQGPGSVGVAAAWSFYPGKNLGAYGDAGAVVTRDAGLEGKIRSLGNYGVRNEHTVVGFNSRLDTLQAVVLSAKLKRLAAWNEKRREAAATYDGLFSASAAVVLPRVVPGNEHVYHQYVVRLPRRDRVLNALRGQSIEAAVHYPRPLHLQQAFGWLGHGPGDFPIAEQAAKEILSLPLFPQIAHEQQERVCEAVMDVLR